MRCDRLDAGLDQCRHNQCGNRDVDRGRGNAHTEDDRRDTGQRQQDQQVTVRYLDHFLRELEADLQGSPLEKLAQSPYADRFFAPLSPIDDVRSSARYRLDAAAELVRRAILACVEAVL